MYIPEPIPDPHTTRAAAAAPLQTPQRWVRAPSRTAFPFGVCFVCFARFEKNCLSRRSHGLLTFSVTHQCKHNKYFLCRVQLAVDNQSDRLILEWRVDFFVYNFSLLSSSSSHFFLEYQNIPPHGFTPKDPIPMSGLCSTGQCTSWNSFESKAKHLQP